MAKIVQFLACSSANGSGSESGRQPLRPDQRPGPSGMPAPSTDPDPQASPGNWLYLTALLLLAAAAVALPVDLRLSSPAMLDRLPGDLRKLVNLSEAFAHGLGAALLLISAWVLDPGNRRRLPRVAACAFGAGGVAQLSKLLIPRLRPNAFHGSDSVWDTFLGREELALEPFRQMSHVNVQSLPSGHTATAVGLALGLAWLYPHGRWLFFFLAALAGFQRIFANMHYLSDVLAGAALGCLVAGMFLDRRLLGRVFTRLEQTPISR
jgi:membrane-associated phospholipid phosphatase